MQAFDWLIGGLIILSLVVNLIPFYQRHRDRKRMERRLGGRPL